MKKEAISVLKRLGLLFTNGKGSQGKSREELKEGRKKGRGRLEWLKDGLKRK